MKTLKLIAALVLVALVSTSTFAQETQNRDVKGYNAIDVSEGIKVYLTMGKTEKVEVVADEDIIDQVITEVSGTELDIYIKGNNWKGGKRKVVVNVTAKAIESIDASSGSSVKTTNTVEADRLALSGSSGAHLNVDLKASKLSCDTSSGAHADLEGEAGMFKAEASSGSHINAEDVKSKRVNADVSSGAHISCHADEEIIAEASSGGSVKYSGSPKMVDVDKSSGGSVRKF